MRRTVGFALSLAGLLAAAASGILAVQVASAATAAHPAPVNSSSPLAHVGLSASAAQASARAKPASAAARRLRLLKCDEAPGGRCGTVRVALDRADPSRGTIPIFFEYYRHRGRRPTKTAILATLGGPGASVTQDPFVSDAYREMFGPLLKRRDLILVDQRGVGRSRAIKCRQLQKGPDNLFDAVAACAGQLGSAAGLYGSTDVALDIDAVRRALRIKKLDFYGGSYSAMDIQAYALRFPKHLRSAVLDSPNTAVGPHDFDVTTVEAVNRTVRLICARSRMCAAERNDALLSVAGLAARLRSQPVVGVGRDAVGKAHQLRITEAVLLWNMLASDKGAYAAISEMGAAADALAAGDAVPLLRLAAEHDEPIIGEGEKARIFSEGDSWARFCTDHPMAWDKNAPLATRQQQWQAAVAALPQDRFSPFSIEGWLSPFPSGPIGPDDGCMAWPAPTGDVAPPVPEDARFPGSVPALILSADLDTTTPTADARLLADAWPNSRFIEVAGSGHHTTLNTRGECAVGIVVRFIRRLKPGKTGCARRTKAISIPTVGRFPLTADGARPATVGAAGKDDSTEADRKVAAVVAAAITDALRRPLLQPEPTRGVGLRGGTFTPKFSDRGISLKLKNFRFAEDVAVSGRVKYPFQTEVIDARVSVNGPGSEDGRLRVRGVWFGFAHRGTVLRIRGSLDGRRVALRVPAT
jgi:pimeloyl-ACP methyl ester carboxylesterase